MGAGCGRCGAELADHAIQEDGGHRHRFVNAAGIPFVVGCWSDAPGCVASGPATDEDTWFAGCTWQRAFCRRCGAHAGWLFRGKTRVFFALIAS